MGLFRRTPKEDRYFDLFDKHISKTVEGLKIFCSGQSPAEKAKVLDAKESAADKIVHQMHILLDEHRDPPVESIENIQALIRDIDHIFDWVEKAANRIKLYQLTYEPEFIVMGKMILEASQKIQKCLQLFQDITKNHKEIKILYIGINDIESRGDDFHRDFIGKTVVKIREGKAGSSSLILKDLELLWKVEITHMLERALDAAEHVADTLESLKRKNA